MAPTEVEISCYVVYDPIVKKGLFLGALLAVYSLLTVYIVQSPPTADSGASSVDRNEQGHQQGKFMYPELETGLSRSGPGTEKAVREVAEALAKRRDLLRRPALTGPQTVARGTAQTPRWMIPGSKQTQRVVQEALRPSRKVSQPPRFLEGSMKRAVPRDATAVATGLGDDSPL